MLWQFLDDLLPKEMYERFAERITNQAIEWQTRGAGVEWMLVLGAAFAVIIIGVFFSVIGSIVVFYGFTLSRTGEDIYRSYGLFTRRSSSLPRRRIQLLKVEETWLRRLFRLAALRADTAGSSVQPGQNKEEQSGRDVLLPVVPRADVDSLLPIFFPDLDRVNGAWQQVSRRAIRRGTRKGAAVCLLLAAISCAVQRSWHGLWPLLFIPAVYALNVMSYRHLGYWLGEPFWGRGFATEAARVVADYAFAAFDVARLEAGVFEWNPASGRVLEKAGFHFEARLAKAVFKDGRLMDRLLYARFRTGSVHGEDDVFGGVPSGRSL